MTRPSDSAAVLARLEKWHGSGKGRELAPGDRGCVLRVLREWLRRGGAGP